LEIFLTKKARTSEPVGVLQFFHAKTSRGMVNEVLLCGHVVPLLQLAEVVDLLQAIGDKNVELLCLVVDIPKNHARVSPEVMSLKVVEFLLQESSDLHSQNRRLAPGEGW
jgi:hypothetical protein